MEKIYRGNVEYNKHKRRTSVVLCILLLITMLGTASVFVALKQWAIVVSFAIFLIVPLTLFPAAINNYPTDGRPIVTITDKEVKVIKDVAKIKDIQKVKIIIDLPKCSTDSENLEMLKEYKSLRPSEEWYGSFDLVVNVLGGKKRVLYSHIDGCIDALKTLIELGVKNYEITYSVKKLTENSDYDFLKELSDEKQVKHREMQQMSEKQKRKQLI